MPAAATGTRDIHYDLVSVLYHTLQEADSLETYIEDAKQRGDEDLARFFEEINEEDRVRADRAKQMLADRIPEKP